jgi:hypothetical protein
MTVPADGIDRLIHFVDERIAQLNLSKEEVARRGGPARDTLAKIRGRRDQQTPMVGTLLRLDAALGWQPGSAAVALLGGQPLSLTARSRAVSRPKKHALQRMSEREIMVRLVCQLYDEITRLKADRDAIDARIRRLRTIHDSFTAELTVDEDLADEYSAADNPSSVAGAAAFGGDRAATATTIHGHARVLSPGSLSGRASRTPGPVKS